MRPPPRWNPPSAEAVERIRQLAERRLSVRRSWNPWPGSRNDTQRRASGLRPPAGPTNSGLKACRMQTNLQANKSQLTRPVPLPAVIKSRCR